MVFAIRFRLGLRRAPCCLTPPMSIHIYIINFNCQVLVPPVLGYCAVWKYQGREGRGKYFLYLPYVLLRQAQLRIIAPWQTTRVSSTGPEIDRSDFDRALKQPLNFQRKRPTWFFRLIVCTHSIVRDSFPFGVGPSPSPKEHPRIPAQTHRTTLLQSRTC